MRYAKNLAKIGLIASKEDSRFVLTCLHLDVDSGVLVVTDGHRLVVQKVEVDPGDITGNIPVEAIKVLHQQHKAVGAVAWLDCSDIGVVTVRCGSMIAYQGKRDPGRYPNWQAHVPAQEMTVRANMTISLDAKYLYEMAQAMDPDTSRGCHVTLLIEDEDCASAITVLRGEGAIGVLMPVRTDRWRATRFWGAKEPEVVAESEPTEETVNA